MGSEATKILAVKGDLNDFRRLLHGSWLLKKRIRNMIAISVVDDMYEKAITARARSVENY